MYVSTLKLSLFIVTGTCFFIDPDKQLKYHQNPAPDGHRCGVCPTYFQKICGFNFPTNSTFIFDNHCIMDLYNCLKGTEFVPLNYDHCLYFGNFAYVHGFKYEDEDYADNAKNPTFVR